MCTHGRVTQTHDVPPTVCTVDTRPPPKDACNARKAMFERCRAQESRLIHIGMRRRRADRGDR